MYNITIQHSHITTVAMETQQRVLLSCMSLSTIQKYLQYCHKNVTCYLCTAAHGFALHCCWATKHFLLLSTTQKYLGHHTKCQIFCLILTNLEFPDRFFIKSPIWILMQIWYTHTDRQTDRQTDRLAEDNGHSFWVCVRA